MSVESDGAWKSGLCDLHSCVCTQACCRIYWTPCYPYGDILASMSPEETEEMGAGGKVALQCQSLMGFVGFGCGDAYGVCCCFFLYCLRGCDTGYVPVTVPEVAACIVVPLALGSAAPMIVPILCPIHLICRVPLRAAIRKKYNIPGSESEDCMILWCCSLCALKQVVCVDSNLSAASQTPSSF